MHNETHETHETTAGAASGTRIDIDDDGFSELIPGREDGAGDPMVREAVRACPVSAITVTEAAG